MALRIPFPMNVSSLRAEYAKEGLYARGTDSATGGSPHMRLDLRDSLRSLETPAVSSPNLTAASVELLLDEIARTLRAHDIRAAVLFATDVRDKLFLADELRRRLPDLRLAMTGTNALLLRADHNGALRGALVASTYPLFLENQFWDPRRAGDRYRQPFQSDIAQGVYNAILTQLGRPELRAEYAEPFAPRDSVRPPVWVMLVGARGYQPLGVFSHGLASTLATPHADAPPPDFTRSDELLRLVVLFTTAAGVLGVMLFGTRRARLEAARTCVDDSLRERLRTTEERTGDGSPSRSMLLRRTVHRLSLVAHGELYSIVCASAALGVVVPLCGVLLHNAVVSTSGGGAARALTGASPEERLVVAGAIVLGAIVFAGAAMSLWHCSHVAKDGVQWGGEHLVKRTPDRTLSPHLAWWFEVGARGGVLAASAVYVILLALLVRDVASLPRSIAAPFLLRVAALDSGLSPAVPLMLIGASYACWSGWHLLRVRLLGRSTAFEEAQMLAADAPLPTAGATAATNPASPRRLATAKAVREGARDDVTAGGSTYTPAVSASSDESGSQRIAQQLLFSPYSPAPSLSDLGPPPSSTGATRLEYPDDEEGGSPADLQRAVFEVRASLFRLVPRRLGWALGVVIIGTAAWLWKQWTPTYEAAVLPHRFATWLGLTAFDLLFRLGVLASLAATCLGVLRFAAVWAAFRRVLNLVAETPLSEAISRLPPAVSRLGRLTPLDPMPNSLLDKIINERFATMRLSQGLLNATESERDAVAELFDEYAKNPPASRGVFRIDLALGLGYAAIDRALSDVWRREHTAAGRSEKDAHERIRRWRETAEECAAAYVVDYVEWVLRGLRHLAGALCIALVVSTVLVTSYPFQPATLVRLLLFVILGASVTVLVAVSFSMNRNIVLSQITRTTANKLEFDAGLLMNIGLYAIVPILTALSAQVPQLRGVLFAWVTPLLRAFGAP
jgi:hypothetical protein